MDDRKRVVITGMGMATAVGLDEKEFWSNLLAGKTGIRHVAEFDVSAYKTKFAAMIEPAAFAERAAAAHIPSSDKVIQSALFAARQALAQAGLIPDCPPYSPQPIPIVFGTGAGCAGSLTESYGAYAAKGPRGLRPTTVLRCMANAISSQLSLHFRLTGSNYMTVSACTSSTIAIGIAFRMIRDGYARAVLCGGSEALVDPANFASWDNLGVMSRSADPAAACRPFDRGRDGCVLGEGAGALVLESLDSALDRGVRIRAEICGFGESSDADHITRPSVAGQAAAMRDALRCAGISPSDVGFINAHGTATRANDACESQSIRQTFGDAADHIPVASNKSYFGHLLGASGAVETIATALGLEAQRVPPNLNVTDQDPECPLRLVGSCSEPLAAPVAMKNSFGFGGSNAVLVLRRAPSA
jgi:3-oxoacyl-[acyl-carrier-protein] synthase II